MNPTLFLVPLLALLAPVSCAATATTPVRPVVYVSIPPQEWVLEQLGALEWVDVHVLLPAASGHVNYSPTPSQIRDLARARMFVRSGLPFETGIWDRLAGLNRTMIVIDAPVESHAHAAHAHEHDHEPAHGHEHDPHFWLDPLLMLVQAEEIAEALHGIVEVDAGVIEANLRQLHERIQAMDARIRERLAESERTAFWTFHGSWGHFAEHYGLRQHAIEFEGKESGLRTMLRLVGELESSGAQFIIIEPGLDRERLAVLQNEAGLTFVELNPMRRDYEQNLLHVADEIARAGL